MGEYAEMMIDGTCCCSCGEFLGDGDGIPSYCASCQSEPLKNNVMRANSLKPKPEKIVSCAHTECHKKFIDQNAMKNHLRTFHIDRQALREKQEKDKKLNAIRNAAPALLEALELARNFIYAYREEDVVAPGLLIKIDAAIAEAARGTV
jgi:hypothetical protein